MQSHILLIEDDDELRSLLARYLNEQGLSVQEAANGLDGLALAQEELVDLVVLDIMLPDINGLEVLRRLRVRTRLPVILLTARGEETDRIIGFEVGADDYIPKPCNPRELVARIQAILRRVAWDQEADVGHAQVIGDLRIEPDQRRIFQNGQPLDLTATEYEILQVLLSRVGSVVRKTDLMQWALGRRLTPHDRTLDMHVSNLRRKLDGGKLDDGKLESGGPPRIETVRGLGYSYRIPA